MQTPAGVNPYILNATLKSEEIAVYCHSSILLQF